MLGHLSVEKHFLWNINGVEAAVWKTWLTRYWRSHVSKAFVDPEEVSRALLMSAAAQELIGFRKKTMGQQFGTQEDSFLSIIFP